MRKITLRLDSLAVESFPTAAAGPAEGTVQAHQERFTPGTCMNSCEGSCFQTCGTCYDTCVQSCPSTCWQSCNGTCVGYSCQVTCVGTCAWCEPFTAGTCLLPCA